MKICAIILAMAFSSAAFAGGATGGFPGLANADVRELIVNKLDFTKLLIHSAQGAPLRINGEVHTLETLDMENRAMLVIPEGGEGDPLLVREELID